MTGILSPLISFKTYIKNLIGGNSMKYKHISSAIHVLQELFHNTEHKNHFLAMKTLEMYIDLNLFQDAKLVAAEIERQTAFGLLAPLALYDMITAEKIEQHLRGL